MRIFGYLLFFTNNIFENSNVILMVPIPTPQITLYTISDCSTYLYSKSASEVLTFLLSVSTVCMARAIVQMPS